MRNMKLRAVLLLYILAIVGTAAFGWLATPGNLSGLVIIWKGMGG